MNLPLKPKTLPQRSTELVVPAIAQSARLPFLVLTPVCVFLGVSIALQSQTDINIGHLSLIVIGALLAHISVNLLNDYHDFKSGLDFNTRRTPFNGGSGFLPKHPEQKSTILIAGIASLTAVIAIGLFFVWTHGLAIIPIGVTGILLIIYYTGWINRRPLLCLIAPGLGFGVLMVLGTQFLLQKQYSILAGLAAIVPFCLVNNLLLLNQYPDLNADTEAGRYHLPIARGIPFSNAVYALFIMLTIMTVILCVAYGYFPLLSLISLLPIPLGLYALVGAIRYGASIGEHPEYLAVNTATAILTPLLLALSLLMG